MKALIFLWTLLGTSTAWADDNVQRHFVIVGNNHSIDQDVQDLEYADDDAVMYERLFRPFATRVDLLTVLDDSSQARHPGMAKHTLPPTRAELMRVLRQSYEEIQRERAAGQRTELFFAFIGHGGVDDEGKGFVHLADNRFSRADLFREIVAKSPADITHVILDACNAFTLVAGRGTARQRKVDPTFARFLSGHDLENYPSVGVIVATSARRETHEWSRIGGGVFSYQVRSALAGAADINHDDRVEYSEVAAFVDAANAELKAAGKRISTFAWPPRRDRNAALLSLNDGRGLRRVTIEAPVSGRLFLETETGERWAEFHPNGRESVVVVAPVDEALFLRDGAREVEIEAGASAVSIREAPQATYSVAERGAVDRAFEGGLFAIPYDRAYYRGFVGGQPNLVAVEFANVEVDAPSSLEARVWGVGAGYLLGGSVLRQEVDQGTFVGVDLLLTGGLSISSRLEWGMSRLDNGNDVHRFALLPALMYRWGWRHIALVGGAGAGWSMLAIRDRSTDPTVWVVRTSLGIEALLAGNLWLGITGAYSSYFVTVGGDERLRTKPQGTVSLMWR